MASTPETGERAKPVFAIELGLNMETEYSGAQILYLGRAVPGTDVSGPGWMIGKYTWSGTETIVRVQHASGPTLWDATWKDRASATYF